MHVWKLPRLLAAAVLGCAVAAAAGCAAPASAAGAPVPGQAVRQLTAIAARAARANGDPGPSQVTAVLTTRARALTSATPGDFVPGSGRVRVFLVTMRGHFVANEVSRPAGSAAPAGRYLSLVLDARTFRVLDFGLSPKPPPVPPGSLGPVTHLSVGGGASTDRAASPG